MQLRLALYSFLQNTQPLAGFCVGQHALYISESSDFHLGIRHFNFQLRISPSTCMVLAAYPCIQQDGFSAYQVLFADGEQRSTSEEAAADKCVP